VRSGNEQVVFLSQSSCRINSQSGEKRKAPWTTSMLGVPESDREKVPDTTLFYSGYMPHWQDDFRVVSIP
jgi:hypothetical protein